MVRKFLVFEIFEEEDHSWTATCSSEDIFTEGANFRHLKNNVEEAVRAHFQGENHHKLTVHLDKMVTEISFLA